MFVIRINIILKSLEEVIFIAQLGIVMAYPKLKILEKNIQKY